EQFAERQRAREESAQRAQMSEDARRADLDRRLMEDAARRQQATRFQTASAEADVAEPEARGAVAGRLARGEAEVGPPGERLDNLRADLVANAIKNDPAMSDRIVRGFMAESGLASPSPEVFTDRVAGAVEAARGMGQIIDTWLPFDEGNINGQTIDEAGRVADMLDATANFLESASRQFPE